MNLPDFSSLLGVVSPWYIKEVKTQVRNQVIDIYIDFEKGSQFPCPVCGRPTKVYDSSYKRIRHLDLFEFRCYLNVKIPRVDCNKDGVKTSYADKWSNRSSHYSIKFEAMVLRFLKEMSMSSLANEVGEPDNNLWRVFNRHVNTKIKSTLDLSNVTKVCVDETASKRGHSYITIFTDYDSGEVIYVTEGRKKEVFEEFYSWLWDHRGHPGEIELFSMDMSKSYQAGKNEYFAHAEIVFDKFHIKKGLNKSIDDLRKQEVSYTDELKKTKYLWLKNQENLNEKQKQQLEVFLDECSLNTAKAYQLKNGFDALWKVQKLAVEAMIKAWIKKATALNLKPINQFIKSVERNMHGIINSITTGITNAVSEGINSTVQLARNRARGYRNINNYINMVYFLGKY